MNLRGFYGLRPEPGLRGGFRLAGRGGNKAKMQAFSRVMHFAFERFLPGGALDIYVHEYRKKLPENRELLRVTRHGRG